MSLVHVDHDFLQLDYDEDATSHSAQSYFDDELGHQPFNNRSAEEMRIMLQTIGKDLSLDEYSLKKLEIFLRTELPFFAVTRRLVRQCVNQNFVY